MELKIYYKEELARIIEKVKQFADITEEELIYSTKKAHARTRSGVLYFCVCHFKCVPTCLLEFFDKLPSTIKNTYHSDSSRFNKELVKRLEACEDLHPRKVDYFGYEIPTKAQAARYEQLVDETYRAERSMRYICPSCGCPHDYGFRECTHELVIRKKAALKFREELGLPTKKLKMHLNTSITDKEFYSYE